MTTQFVGTTFPPASQWYQDEKDLIASIVGQIQAKWPDERNLLINSTWFGPQFDNGQYAKFINITDQQKFDNLFVLAAADPVFLSADQIKACQERSGARRLYQCGHFDGPYQFNFHSWVIDKFFMRYDEHDLLLLEPNHIFLNYNRKPRSHRVELVKKFMHAGLDQRGIITLGRNDPMFSQDQDNKLCLLLDETVEDYAKEGNWSMPMTYGIPHDIHSLGNMDIWQGHFLTVVSETEFFPWDNLFVSEKTWKPIIGMRPFLINGQSQVYAWLRRQGFRTFERYWPDIACEDLAEHEVHDSIIKILTVLSALSKSSLMEMYQDMLPDLRHNRSRFFEFSQEQKHKADNLFS